MRLSSLAALALLAAAAPAPAEASSSPFFSGLVSGLKSLLSSTDAAVSSALKKFADFNALATAIATEADGNLTAPARSDPAAIGAFSQVALLDTPSTFTARQTASVNVNAAVAQYIFRDAFNATCPAAVLSPICQHLADIAANSLNFLPSLFLFESVSAAAPAPVVNINATADQLLLDVRGSADAILNYVLFPAPSASINKLFSLLGARVMPTASVTYAAASGAVFADLVHLLDVGANASSISVTQAFESILEYTDANGNGRYDRGEKIASTYDLYNRPFKPAVATNYTNPQGVVIRTVTSTTLDNVVTIACDVSASPVSSGSDQINIRAPSATGCSIKIANFPYASKSNLLALTGYVGSAIASAKGQGAALANITVYNTTDSALGYKTDLDLPLKAYAVWGAWAYAIPSVAANGTISDSAKAKAVFAAGFDLTDNANHLGLSARFTAFAKASARGSFTVRQFNFSLGDAAGSKQITWSNVIGVGTDALKAQAQASHAAPALFSGVLALVPAIALAALSLL